MPKKEYTEYRVKKGDNLWNISKRNTTKATNWSLISKYNNLKNPDLIYPDQIIRIPNSLLKEQSDLQTLSANKLQQRSNSQLKRPVQQPAKKDSISRDTTARDTTKVNTVRRDTVSRDTTSRNNTVRKPVHLPVKVKSSTKKDTSKIDTSKIVAKPKTVVKLNPSAAVKPKTKLYTVAGTLENEPTMLSEVTVTSKHSLAKPKKQIKQPKNNTVLQNKNDDEKSELWGLITNPNMSVSDKLSVIKNGLIEKVLKKFGIGTGNFAKQNDKKTVIKKTKPSNTHKTNTHVIDESKIYEDVVGDTIWDNGDRRRFVVPGSFNLDNVLFGTRNRYETNKINNTEGITVPTMKLFVPYESVEKSGNLNYYVGIDETGHIKSGKISDFSPGSYVSQVYHYKYAGSKRNGAGGLQWQPAVGNDGAYMPTATRVYDDNTVGEVPVNMLNWRGENANSFGGTWRNTNGGSVLVSTPYEHRRITGSANAVMQQLDDMYRNYKNTPLDVFVLDNGTFATGYQTIDKMLYPLDLINYDNQNTSGGNGLYQIIPHIAPEQFYTKPLHMPGINSASFVFDE